MRDVRMFKDVNEVQHVVDNEAKPSIEELMKEFAPSKFK